VICHCRTCQQLSAGASMAFYHVPLDAMGFLAPSLAPSWSESYTDGKTDPATQTKAAGQLRVITVTPFAARSFCSICGTPIYFLAKAHKRASLSVSTLDEVPEDLKVTKHIFVKEKAPWEVLPDDGAPRFDES
jgi:hypothetical protein